MQALPQALYNAAQTRDLDRRAIERGISGRTLMERAGEAALAYLRLRWPRARRIAVVCGPGNNGGDGFVLARLAHAAGLEVTPLALAPVAEAKGDAAEARAACEALVRVTSYGAHALSSCDLIVDALLGTGLEHDVTGTFRAAIEDINAAGRPVFALDIPSGLHADTGRVMGAAVRADATVTFIGLKAGLFTGQAPDHRGDLAFNDLDVPSDVYREVKPFATRLTWELLAPCRPKRRRAAHKGDNGHVLVAGGDEGMAGAVMMAGTAAYRAGAGLVTVVTHPNHAPALAGRQPELIVAGVANEGQWRWWSRRATVLALGPGLGEGVFGQTLWRQAIESRFPLVFDADALNILAYDPFRRDDWVLTPHPGEAARLLNCSPAEVQADRFQAARKLVERLGGVCVLKGAGTVIARGGELAVCDRGNPGLATGGTGDILTGVIAGLLAQGLSAWDAARLGVWLHASAGDAAAAQGEIGLMATDLLPHIRMLMNA